MSGRMQQSEVQAHSNSHVCADQAFCAGGDVKATVQQIMRGEGDHAPRYALDQTKLL